VFYGGLIDEKGSSHQNTQSQKNIARYVVTLFNHFDPSDKQSQIAALFARFLIGVELDNIRGLD